MRIALIASGRHPSAVELARRIAPRLRDEGDDLLVLSPSPDGLPVELLADHVVFERHGRRRQAGRAAGAAIARFGADVAHALDPDAGRVLARVGDPAVRILSTPCSPGRDWPRRAPHHLGAVDMVTVSSETARRFVLHEWQAPPSRVAVIGAPAADLRNIRRHDRADGPVVLTSTSDYTDGDQTDRLFDAFSACALVLPNLRLLLAGTGPRRRDVEAQATHRGMRGRVDFVDPQANVSRAIAHGHIFIAPSAADLQTFDLLDAMSTGLACIVPRVGDLTEIADGAALTVPHGNQRALAKAIALLATDPAERKRLGDRARARIESGHDAAGVGRTHRDLYRQLHRDGSCLGATTGTPLARVPVSP